LPPRLLPPPWPPLADGLPLASGHLRLIRGHQRA
jgi:hypothetical protein